MKYSARIKPIGALRANASALVRELSDSREPLILTEGGEARAVLQDVRSYEETQDALALLKILALGARQIEDGRVRRADEVIAGLRASRNRG